MEAAVAVAIDRLVNSRDGRGRIVKEKEQALLPPVFLRQNLVTIINANMNYISQTLFSLILLLGFSPGVFSHSDAERVEDTGSSSEKARLITFLGVGTNRVSNALRHHVEIPHGVGLIIEHVVEDSPADKAGIEQFDILLGLDDQVIINQEQLTTLVRSKEPEDTVEVEIVRKGEKLEFSVNLEEREAPREPRMQRHFNSSRLPSRSPGGDWDFPFKMEDFDDYLKKIQEKAAEMGKKALQYAPEIIVERENEDGSHRITTYGKGQKRVRLSRNGLIATMEITDGDKHFRITDEDDQVLYEGGEPEEEDLEKLPKEVRSMIKKLRSSESFNLKSFKDLKGVKIRIIIDTDKEKAGQESNSTEEKVGG